MKRCTSCDKWVIENELVTKCESCGKNVCVDCQVQCEACGFVYCQECYSEHEENTEGWHE